MLAHAPPALALAVLLAMLARCESPAEPEGSAGRFVLAALDGQAPPAVMITHDHGATYIVADTLWLETDGTGERHTTYRVTDQFAGRDDRFRAADRLTYRRAGSAIEISFECNDVVVRAASCVPPPHLVGELGGTTLVVTDLHDNELRYVRR